MQCVVMKLNSWQIGIAVKTNDLYIKQLLVNRPLSSCARGMAYIIL